MAGSLAVVAGRAPDRDVDSLVDRLGDVGDAHGAVVQAFDARYVAGRGHLERAVSLAERERERGAAIADDPAVEILLYAAGRRQIDEALEMGVTPGEPAVAVAAGGDEGVAAALRELFDDAGETAHDPDRVRAFFDVGDAELDATRGDLADIVRERVALLVVER